MSYKNGKDILPARLLNELQQYIEGDLLYIPRRTEERIGWGRRNGTRSALEERNRAICNRRAGGEPITVLAADFHLSAETVRRIAARR